MYSKVRADIRKIVRTLSNYKKVEIFEGVVCDEPMFTFAQAYLRSSVFRNLWEIRSDDI